MRAFVLPQIPDPYIPRLVATDQLALIRVDNHVVDGATVAVIPLHRRRSGIPDLYRPVFGRCYHPFTLAVEPDAGDIVSVAFEGEHGGWIGGFDVVELDVEMSRRGEEALVRGDAEAVYLTVRVLDRARADAGEGFPEAVVPWLAAYIFFFSSYRAGRRTEWYGRNQRCT